MKKSYLHGALLTLLLFCVGFFAYELAIIDDEVHANLRSDLWHLDQLHTKQHENILLVESGLMNHYDPISYTSEEIHTLAEDILALKPEQLTSYRIGLLNLLRINSEPFHAVEQKIHTLLESYQDLLRQEDTLLEEYKRHHAVLINSIRYMPLLGKELATLLEGRTALSALRNDVALASDDLLLLYASRDHALFEAIHTRLDRLEQKLATLATPEQKKLERFLQHSRLILKHLARDHQLIDTIVHDGVVEHIQTLHDYYTKHQMLVQQDIRLFTIGLFLSALLLVIYISTLVSLAFNKARRMAQSASQMKSEFLASMSHEIRTPMNGIIGMTEIMLSEPLSDVQKQRAQMVLSSADALLGIINDILDFSKIESGKMELEGRSFSLEKTAEEVIALLLVEAKKKGLLLLLHYLPGTPKHIIGDSVRIRQVMLNLIGNAIKFTESGQVQVMIESTDPPRGTTANSTWIRLSVTDTGIGIAEEKQPHIFDKFTQADGSTTRKFGGTGLGLAISRNLVELMDGRIGFHSRNQEGTTFWVMLPVEVAE